MSLLSLPYRCTLRRRPPAGRSILLPLVLLALAGPAAGQVVGDADQDGLFSAADLAFAEDHVRFGSSELLPLADVAEPCDGRLGPADGLRLKSAVIAARHGLEVSSRCHREAIGQTVQPPAGPPPLVTLDDLFVTIAERAPHFGGLYIADGKLHVVLTETGELGAALEAIERVFGSERFAELEAVAVPGTYTFPQLAAWKAAARDLLGEGVTSIDADERANRLRLGLRDPSLEADVEAELRRRRIPPTAVVFETKRAAPVNADPLLSGLRKYVRPLRGGIVIGTDDRTACAFGFLAKRLGQIGMVTNAHCLAPLGVDDDRVVLQDALDPTDLPEFTWPFDTIGTELVDPPLKNGNELAADASFVALDPDEHGYLGRVAGSPGVPGYFGLYSILGKREAVCGDFLFRIGPGTGQGGGYVEKTCVDREADWTPVPDSPLFGELPCQMVYSGAGIDGDSGAPLLTLAGNGSISDTYLAGIHWGGLDEGLGSPISGIDAVIGPLQVHRQNETPTIDITVPSEGTVFSGSFIQLHMEADVWDFEGEAYNVDWSWLSWHSGGNLGTGTDANGIAMHDALLPGGLGPRLIIGTITDNYNASSDDSVLISVGNEPPSVVIDWPGQGETLWADVPHQLHGSSLDPETFSPLPCGDLQWSLNGPSSGTGLPTTGCHPVVTFNSTGVHILSLSGTDGDGASDTASVVIHVTPAPSGTPIISFLSPPDGHAVPPHVPVTVVAEVSDLGDSAPISLEWSAESPHLLAPGTSTPLETGSVLPGGTASVTFVPADLVKSGCGFRPLSIRLQATDVDANGDDQTLHLDVGWPPC